MEKLQKILIDFEDLVNKEIDVDEILDQVEELKDNFEDALEDVYDQKLDEFLAEGGEQGNFAPEKLPEQAKYNDLVFIVNERKRKKDETIALEHENNLSAKKDIIASLRNLIENEEHIGKAFETLNDLREQWKSIGNVSSHDYKPLQAEYSNLLEVFFYNINIYKELKDHDLKRNLQLREDLIAKMEALLEEKHIKQVQTMAGTYLSEWDEIGPIHKDEWTKVRDKFKTITKKVFQRVKDHYNEIKEKHQKNLEAKQELIAKVQEVVNAPKENEKDWRKHTETVLSIQKEWKKVGFATKKDNETIWAEFRALCDLFFDSKAKFYEKAKSKWDENKTRKQELIAKAEELKNSTDWKETSNQLIRLQKDWKNIGPAGQKVEQALWKQFRGACDAFFNAKKEYYDTLDDRLADNLKAKQEFIKSLAKTKLEGDKAKDRATIKQLMTDWSKLGQVPRDNVKDIAQAFDQAIDALYDKIGESKAVESIKYEDKIEALGEREKAEKLLRDEIQFIKTKIEVLTKDKLQYENNLSFLGFSKGAAADKMREDVNKKIAAVDAMIDGWEKKRRLVSKTLRNLNQPQEETKQEENQQA